ncbi:MAG: hypothetical protein JO197_11810 [Acidobacteria bacterium]|nr:hypothetical protein [Acidobacteriota bacterium]MBV9476162.1 hypothetical protein [Acidobacteriota bacterium]
MKRFLAVALVSLGCLGVAYADGLSLSVSVKDSRTSVGPHRELRDARLTIVSRDGMTALMLLENSVAVQLTDRALAQMKSEEKKKDGEEKGFLEGLIEAAVMGGVKFATGKSLEFPIASIRSVDYTNDELRLLNDKNERVFEELKVNHVDELRNFAPADAARFVSALRAAKARK